MFGIGMPEMILILAIALIVIGPKKLPDLAKSLGRAMREFKKATSEFKESMELDNEFQDVKQTFDDINDDIKGSFAAKEVKDGADDLNQTKSGNQIKTEKAEDQPKTGASSDDGLSEDDVEQVDVKGSAKNG
jgi:TatA/E family protein of Tat protein translocase